MKESVQQNRPVKFMIRHRSKLAALSILFSSVAITPFAHATIAELFGQLNGTTLPKSPRTFGQGKPRKVLLNGFPLQLISETAQASQQDVIGYYREHFLMVEPSNVRSHFTVQSIGQDASFLLGVGSAVLTEKDLTEKGMLALLTGRPLRLVYAQRSANRTDYVAAWSEIPLPESVLAVPGDQDAPGSDIPTVPRPSGRRIFSFSEPASGWAMASYRSEGPVEAVFRQVITSLKEAGFDEDPAFKEVRSRSNDSPISHRYASHVVSRDRELMVTVRPARQGSSTITNYVSKLH